MAGSCGQIFLIWWEVNAFNFFHRNSGPFKAVTTQEFCEFTRFIHREGHAKILKMRRRALFGEKELELNHGGRHRLIGGENRELLLEVSVLQSPAIRSGNDPIQSRIKRMAIRRFCACINSAQSKRQGPHRNRRPKEHHQSQSQAAQMRVKLQLETEAHALF